MHQPERRRSRRFALRQPVYVRELGSSAIMPGMTQNVSKDGLLLHTDFSLPIGSKVELVLLLESRLEKSIRLSGKCAVVRTDPLPSSGFAIALSSERPFAMMD